MVNTRYKFVAILGLVISGSSWGAQPIGVGPPPGSLKDCNNNLQLQESQLLDFGAFVGGWVGTASVDPATKTASYIGLTSVIAGVPGLVLVTVNTTGDCSAYKVNITITPTGTLAGPGVMTVGSWTSYFEDASGAFVDPTVLATSGFAGFGVIKSPLYIYVGATLTVQGNEPVGIYSGNYSVDVTFSP